MNPQILIVEDDEVLRDAVRETAEIGGYKTICANDGEAALRALAETEVQAVISDVQMRPLGGQELLKEIRKTDAKLPVILMTAYGSISGAVSAMRDGASDYLAKPFDAEVLINQLSNFIALPAESDRGEIVLASDAARTLDALVTKVATTDSAVMITGESGVGKEVVFRLLHQHSSRRENTPIAVNCAAIPDNMLEAMLFGYEKGAFTGAYKASAGKFEQANGSSLLLDEVTEMSMPLQAKLLRVLQEQQVERLGSNRLIDLDVRIIATSNRDLKREVADGNFREDLYFRLNVFPIAVPPLRDRIDDILPLAQLFVARACAKQNHKTLTISAPACAALEEYHWPGNVRELDNVIQRATILCDEAVISVDDLVFESNDPTNHAEPPAEDQDSLGDGLRDHERRIILTTLRECNGSRKETAKQLNISPRTLRYKIAEMRADGVDIPGR
ncbi:MAG: sigma-54 dependent transcriptional regulator [Pseudomonadota bacterium]